MPQLSVLAANRQDSLDYWNRGISWVTALRLPPVVIVVADLLRAA